MENLKIACIQTTLFWENAEANRQHFAEKIRSIQGHIDLIVLPEMFTTGFSMQPDSLSESMSGTTMEWMQVIAQKSNAALTGSVIIREGEHFYNRMIWMMPDGSLEYYDKRHLFSLAGEHERYTAGNKLKIVSYKNWRIALFVCYDLRFPVWSRNVDAYDCALYVANWPKPRVHAWSALLQARAIENQCYVVGVNRVGTDGNGHEYTGQSAVIDMQGNDLTHAADRDDIVFSELSKEQLSQFRSKFPFYLDADEYKISVHW
jgi:predicted amidohydrolase